MSGMPHATFLAKPSRPWRPLHIYVSHSHYTMVTLLTGRGGREGGGGGGGERERKKERERDVEQQTVTCISMGSACGAS